MATLISTSKKYRKQNLSINKAISPKIFPLKTKYFRISLTNKCNLNCYFCHNEGQSKQGKNMLSANDIVWVSKIAKEMGYNKFKLTGGEPTLHPEILDIVYYINKLKVEDLSMITNGSKLYELAFDLKRCGLHRLNVSLYTLNPDKFWLNNKGNEKLLNKVILGIDKALEVGYTNLKINYVWDNDDNINDFLEICKFAKERNIVIVLLPVIDSKSYLTERIELISLYNKLQELGIKEEKNIVDNEGIIKRIVTLNNGAKVLIRDEELKDKLPYNLCKNCEKVYECREGIFPTRFSASGKILPCLANDSFEYDIKPFIIDRNEREIKNLLLNLRTL